MEFQNSKHYWSREQQTIVYTYKELLLSEGRMECVVSCLHPYIHE